MAYSPAKLRRLNPYSTGTTSDETSLNTASVQSSAQLVKRPRNANSSPNVLALMDQILTLIPSAMLWGARSETSATRPNPIQFVPRTESVVKREPFRDLSFSKQIELNYRQALKAKDPNRHPLPSLQARGQTGAVHSLTPYRKPDRARKLQSCVVPAVTIHQLYSLASNLTAIDREVDRLVQNGTLHKFRLGRVDGGDLVVMRSTDYLALASHTLAKNHQRTYAKFERFIRGAVRPNVIITRTKFLRTCGLTDMDLGVLINAGFFINVDTSTLQFSMPGAGVFMGQLDKGRNEVRRIISRAPSRETMESNISSDRYRVLQFHPRFYILDLVGAGELERRHSPMGFVLRVTK
ncbi:Serine/threonine-protein kinase 19 [Dimargaris xerosporica]|nr:Serine/threonine-protein kinase 19 [Dimargaris xerosporica]